MPQLSELLQTAEERKIRFWQLIQEQDCFDRQVTPEQSWEKMRGVWLDMHQAAEAYNASARSRSGLVGGDGEKMRAYLKGEAYSNGYIGAAMAEALSMAESNACMCRIVAAPTAGACGVLPAVLLPLSRDGRATEEQIIQALYVAAGIGQVIAENAFIAGAAGGCQAEIGTASAMAAGALTSLRCTAETQIGHAAAMALKNLLGLVCDPVAGLVEVPCVKRNVIGTVCAVSAADMALAGIESRVPVDQVIRAMRDVGSRMSVELRETALGGLAATPFGEEVKKRRWQA